MKDLADYLFQAFDKRQSERRFMLGVTGIPGSGKSTFSAFLEKELNNVRPRIAKVVPMDGFHFSNEELENMGLLALKGIPSTFDAGGFVQLLERLAEVPPRLVHAPLFDRSIEASIPDAISIEPENSMLIVEGNYLLLDEPRWNPVREVLDETWFIDSSEEEVLPRLIKRHMDGGKTEEQAREKVMSTDFPNAQIIEATKPRADRIVRFQLPANSG